MQSAAQETIVLFIIEDALQPYAIDKNDTIETILLITKHEKQFLFLYHNIE